MESAQHPSSKTEEIVAQLLARASEHGHQPVDAMAGQQCCLLGVAGSAAQQKCAQPAAEVEEQRQKRQFQQWLHLHGNSLYPTREQKERLATQMGTSYGKVNKLFANHRRRQHKQKTASLDKENRRFPAEESNVGRPGAEHIWAAGKSFDGGLPDSSEAGVSAQLTPPPPSQPMPVQQQQFPGPASAADWLQMLMVARQQQQQQQLATGQFFGAPPAVIQQQQQQKGPPPFFNAAPPPPMFSMAEQHRSLQQQSAPAAPNQLLLVALAQAQQQQMAQQQMALMEAAIKKEIVELLDAARSQQNMALLAQHSQLLSQLGQLQREQTQNLITGFHLPPPQPPAHGFFMSSPLIMSPANSAANGSCISPSSSTGSSSDQLPEEEIDPSQLMDLDLIEKQIAAQYNRLSADEAEAVAVLAGLGAIGR